MDNRRIHSRLSGAIFVIGAVFGLVISISCLIILWSTKADVTRRVSSTAALVGSALTATHEMIGVVGTTLDQAATSLQITQSMVSDVSRTLNDSSGLISSTADLVGTNMVDFVNNTQTSLASVQNSAKAVDSILTKISSVPLIGPYLGGGYSPDMPLEASVANVSRSMDPLPGSLTKIRRDLDVSSANVSTIHADIQTLAGQIDSIKANLEQARKVVDEYRNILADVQTRYDAFESRLPVTINIIYIGVTLVLVWILITQIGMLIRGIELMG